MSSTISYNGSTITTLDDGETATLSTAAKYVPYNLVVTDTTDVSDALEAIADKGVTIPSGAGRDDLADLIDQIQQGGSAITITDEPATGGGTHRIITAVSLENDTVTAATLASGVTAHDKFGNAIIGTGGGDTPVIDEWVRPSTWPDLDSIQMANDFEGLYLTYDLSQSPVANPWIGFLLKFVDSSSTATVERGHLSNGTFVADATYTASHNTIFRQNLDEANGTIQLWRIYTSGKITNFQFKSRTSPGAAPINQACVEITGQLNNLVEITSSTNPTSTSSSTTYSWGTSFLQRDSRKCGGTVTSLARAWYYCYALQSLDVSKWNTTNWVLTTLTYCWHSCYSLQSLDVSKWNTTNWEVTDLGGCWCNCYSLQSLDLSNWNTTNWEVTTLSGCWQTCYSLRSLDVSKWNTTNWKVTTLSYCWSSCYSLQSLDLSNWNTTNWEVTILTSTWSYCYSLRALDLSKWKTTNWALTTLSSCWYNCYNLNKLDVSGWSISSTINIGSWFYNCICLNTLKGFNDWTGLTSITSSFISGSWYCLKNCDGFPLSVAHSYSNCRFLTHDSLVSILEALPTIETSTTITLGVVNTNKLTSSEIAIATAKGWTVA